MGEVALSANAVLLNLLMIGAFFLDGIAQAAEQLGGKALGANWRPAFDRAYALSFRWGLAISTRAWAAVVFRRRRCNRADDDQRGGARRRHTTICGSRRWRR